MQDDINKPAPDNSPGQGQTAEPVAATTASHHAAAAAAPVADKSLAWERETLERLVMARILYFRLFAPSEEQK